MLNWQVEAVVLEPKAVVRMTPRSAGGTDAVWLSPALTKFGQAARSAAWHRLEDEHGFPLSTNIPFAFLL